MVIFTNLLSFFKKNYKGLSLLLIAHVAVYYKFYIYRLLPFPGDLLVSFFFPWSSGGFVGFDPWTTHKGQIAADVIRQIYPWKSLAVEMIRNGQWPLWNPYNFSGTPLLANLQSSVFFPANSIFLFLPVLSGWLVLVVGLPLLFGFLIYRLVRMWRFSQTISAFVGIAAMGMSYLVVWSEQIVIIQSFIFLPLILVCIDLSAIYHKKTANIFIPFLLAFSIFGGHIQTTAYVYIIFIAYSIFKRLSWKTRLFQLMFSFLIASIQLLPSIELYLHSARETGTSLSLFLKGVLPLQSLVTIIAPDFFGNPAVLNFWGQSYGDFQLYTGLVTCIFALMGILFCFKTKTVQFLLLLGVSTLIFSSYPGVIFKFLNIPILSSGVVARLTSVFQFCIILLSAYGYQQWTKKSDKGGLYVATAILFILVGLYVFTYLSPNPNLLVARNNLKLPLLVDLFFIFVCILSAKFRGKFSYIIRVLPIGILILESIYFFNKFTPFSPREFVFPKHQVLSFLQNNSGINRFYGFGSSYIDNNFATYYKIFSAEGYDSLYIKGYGELLSTSQDGKLQSSIKRSDANFGPDDNYYRNRLFDLVGVNYILDKNDNPQDSWEPEYNKFPQDKYEMVWQRYKWKVYQRKSTLPRFFLASQYVVRNTDQAILDTIYDKNFNLSDILVLEKAVLPNLSSQLSTGKIGLVSYLPNEVKLETDVSENKLLFLSDVYYPGWEALVDGKKTEIFRSDFIFRSIFVPSGIHKIDFRYNPITFQVGLLLTLVSSFILIILARKK